MNQNPGQRQDARIRPIAQAILGTSDPQIKRIVATVDAMTNRGDADLLIEPLRQRLTTIRPPRPLRFARLLFHPFDLLVVPAARWRPGQHALPRTVLLPMADHVGLTMGAAAAAIKAEIAGHTTADLDLISRLGRSLWPVAAAILADSAIPDSWASTELGDVHYRPLANVVAALLAEAAPLDKLVTEAAIGMLPPQPDAVAAMLSRITRVNKAALPMMIALLLDRLPQAAGLLPAANSSPEAAATHAAMDKAADLLLEHLDQDDAIETRIAAGTLPEAAAAASRVAVLLKHLDGSSVKSQRRERVRAARQRLEADCKARFTTSLQDNLLAPLEQVGSSQASVDIASLEATARGLRVLETEARAIGGSAAYDLMLSEATDAIKSDAMLGRLSQVEQVRLVEILSGPDAALAMLSRMK